ncbi:hypothetical protein L226DRAFT_574450, partial [Lentinus tigrinus ALCF2SS1-7]
MFGTLSHPDWILLETVSASPDSPPRVVIYLNRSLRLSRYFLLPSPAHRDLLALSIQHHPSSLPVVILNIYNDRDCTALDHLVTVSPTMPVPHLFLGDFNLHSPDWAPALSTFSSQPRLLLLRTLTDLWSLSLSQPLNSPTFRGPHGTSLIDLVWAPVTSPCSTDVHLLAAAPSDHAFLCSTLSLTVPPAPLSYALREQDLPEFLAALTAALLSSFVPHPSSSADDALRRTTLLFSTLTEQWQRFAVPRRSFPGSKPWWNAACRRARRALLDTYSDLATLHRVTPAYCAARDHYFNTIRDAKRAHFERRITSLPADPAALFQLAHAIRPRPLSHS